MKKVFNLLQIAALGILVGIIVVDPFVKDLIQQRKIAIREVEKLEKISTKYDSVMEVVSSRKWAEFEIYNISGIKIPEHLPDSILEYMELYRAEYDIPPSIFWRLIFKESSFRMVENCSSGAYGFMQVMPDTYNYIRIKANASEDHLDYKNNIKVGTYLLRQHYDLFIKKGFSEYRSWELTLAAYNAGIGNVRKYNYNIPNFKETQNYVAFIMRRHKYNS